MRTKQDVEEELRELEDHIQPLLDRRESLRQELLEFNSQFKVGDTIEWKGRLGYVVEIHSWVGSTPSWIVRRIRKDGSPGAKVQVRHWDKPVKVSPV